MDLGISLSHLPGTWRPHIPETVDPVPDPPEDLTLPKALEVVDETEEPVSASGSFQTESFAAVPKRRRPSQVTQQVHNFLTSDEHTSLLKHRLLTTLRRYIDYIAGVMVLLNSIVLIAELEVEGRSIAFEVGLPSGEDLRAYLPTLRGIDAIFVLVFLVELLMRLAFDGLKFFLDRVSERSP